MDALLQDIRFAARTLLKRPAFTAAVVLTLGLGIAANTAIFSVVNAVLLQPLPFEEADRLVSPNPISNRGFEISLSIPNYYDWKDQARSWESFGAFRGTNAVLTGLDRPEVVRVQQVLGDFFEVLRANAALGRVFDADEAEPGAAPVAVVTHGFWQRRLGGSGDVVGTSITLDGIPYTIVGVMPRDFAFPTDGDEVYLPMGLFAEGGTFSLRWKISTTSIASGISVRLA